MSCFLFSSLPLWPSLAMPQCLHFCICLNFTHTHTNTHQHTHTHISKHSPWTVFFLSPSLTCLAHIPLGMTFHLFNISVVTFHLFKCQCLCVSSSTLCCCCCCSADRSFSQLFS